MTVLSPSPKITSVVFKGLDDLKLPFSVHPFREDVEQDFPDWFLDEYPKNTDKYFIKSVDGFGPPDRDIAIASTAAGGRFQGVTVQDRELVVLIGLNPDWDSGETPKVLRDNLYTMLNTGYDPKVDVQLMSGLLPVAHEYAYISKFETALFSADPMVQITFKTLNPTFRSLGPISYNPEDLSESTPDIYNYGTAETGFMFAVAFTGSMSSWYIKQAENQNIGMTFKTSFASGDILSVSTIPGQRYVHLKKHRGKVKNSLSILTGDSEWIQLHPGHNHFLMPSKTGNWDWNGKLSFTLHYWGV